MENLSIIQTANALREKKFSSVELTNHYLLQINKQKDLNAFISVDEEQALISAQNADKILIQKKGSLLTGIPMAVKDLFCTTTMRTTCGSKMLADFQSPYDATAVSKLLQAGSVLLGKTNMDEFAMGSTNETSYFGAVKNPRDKTRVAGGSSGGSAAAVAGGLTPFALGSDTGGSIRQPAAYCGISGIKPTYGLISRYGMVAYASSLDNVGPMAKTAEDLAVILQALAGFDPKDSTSINVPVPDYCKAILQPLKKPRVGLPSCFFQQQVDPSIQQALYSAIATLKAMGAEVVEIDLKLQNLWVPCYYVIACAEASSNLARYDGLRFGYRSDKQASVRELITASRNEAFGAEVKRRICIGTHVLSSGYFDAYYVQAQKIRRLIQNELLDSLNKVDVIIGPTTPTCALKLGDKKPDPVQNYLGDVFTVAANLAGLPALSIPIRNDKDLPIGMQLMGKHFSESSLLNLAHHFQQHTEYDKVQ